MNRINCNHHWRTSTRDNGRGFTLIETMVVIAILAFLVAILVLVVGNMQKRVTVTKDISNLRAMGIAVSLYTAEFGRYPGAEWYFVGLVRDETILNADKLAFEPLTRKLHLAEKLYLHSMRDSDPQGEVFKSPLAGDPIQVQYRHNWHVFGSLKDGRASPARPAQMTKNIWAISNRDRFCDSSDGMTWDPYENKRNYLFIDGRVERLEIEGQGWDPSPWDPRTSEPGI
jgi:prepilin-type N-terminal cleavage/methylation domain-containing protein/prepilin-type processing-associated H-X9-DG protein